ncbi:flavodoxin reductase family 1 [Serpentinimonas maccroryi]|uniref:Flavodoxin reductase family 1 n=1 Tax=Serpentinimonas maccroryi TaxID=1458426 RepID=A0A060NMV1_9BURK|nr:2Fe-2S iron-sulfur cluster-binding protein [Serpentinimonas maccroryi]BAO83841.1 flavodoxin reductase family 1 [Serpentinimonas maccroryi]
MNLNDHPTVRRVRLKTVPSIRPADESVDAGWLKQLVLEAGADDVGFVEIGRPALDDQREDILKAFPHTKTLVSFVVRMNREAVRTPARSVSNTEFHHSGEEVNHVAREVVQALEDRGIRAMNPAMGFPMEMHRFPNKIWVVSHKPVAVAAGLGMMGIHRNVIHEKFGNFILLGTILVGAEVSESSRPINYNPCLECKLCVAACPVGAISPDGSFNFTSCYTHNYREFMGGFTDWVEQVADSSSARDYRGRVSDSESASMWQSLSYGANYKAAYCLAVCPAGEDVIGPFLADRKAHLDQVVRPLQEREETVYVTQNSDAEDHVTKRFPHKTIKHVGNSLRPNSIDAFLNGMPNVFQPGKSAGLNATYHFTFTGHEQRQVTVVIQQQKISVKEGHVGQPDLRVTADSQTWVGFLRAERNMVWALVRRKIRLAGPPKLLLAFGKCFPSAGGRQERVELEPRPSRLRGEPAAFVKNDPATGEVRWRGKLTLSEVVDEAHEVKTFRFTPPAGGELPFNYLPGQFVTLHIAPGGVPTKRSYTIASSPTWSDRIEITVKREGQGLVSRWLHDELGVGDEVEVEAPNGTFFFSGQEAGRVVLIGGGVGITPLMSAVRYLAETCWPGEVHLVLGFRSPRDFIFREELAALQARHPNLAVTVTMSAPGDEPWSGRVGRIDAALLASAVPNLAAQQVHVCGPLPMMDAIIAALGSLGVPPAQIKREAFGTVKRSPSGKETTSTEIAGRALFLASGVTAPVPVDATILDAADTAGVPIDNACRSGTCASCRVKLVSGRVTMAAEDALTDQDRAEGYILACQAKIQGDVEVDA